MNSTFLWIITKVSYYVADRLASIEVNAEVGIIEWAVSANYYAKYFSVYAILPKLSGRG